ncbi:MAG TPA: sigma-54 dependent transcriptional regulator [Gemmatimonadaceae bacterium]|jgi:DNA-binding NtrC family response regulator
MPLAQASPRILISDDQPDVLEALRLLLKPEGFHTETATSPAGALAALQERDFDALLMDLNYTRDTTSGTEGLELLAKAQATDPTLPVIVMTAWGSIESAVEAMRRGARDYVEKPWDNARLLTTLRTQVDLGRALRATQRLETENSRLRRDGLPVMLGESRAMQPVHRLMEKIAPAGANVLITGEHGTGKEVVARWLHAASPRAGKPLVTVNAGGLSEGVFESEMFGHVRGAFTDAKTDRVGCFELADGGTLFLDEIANVPLAQQAKLLRALENGEVQRVGSSKTRHVDVRVIAATNADVTQLVADGRFREDLLYRLNTVEIRIPPLRNRKDDIPLLANHFLRQQAERYGKAVRDFTPEAMRALLAHAWPGNVRELRHVVERAVLLTPGPSVTIEDVELRAKPAAGPALEEMTLEDAERWLITRALQRHEGNVSRAADALGVSRSALYRRLQQFGIS